MTRNNSRHLLDMLADVPDFRKCRGKRHPLQAVLGLIVIAMMAGYRTYSAMAEYGRTYDPKLAEALGFTHKKTPCGATLHHLLKNIDIKALETTLSQWAKNVLTQIATQEAEAIAVDGKTLIGSQKQDAVISHLLSAVSHQLGITLAQQPADSKTNEIPISQEILQVLDVAGKIVTTDALLTQRSLRQDLRQADADYVTPVKANQKNLYLDIQQLFQPFSDIETPDVEQRRFRNLHTDASAHLDTCETVEKADGFITTRTLRASTLLNDYLTWPDLAQVYEYRCERIHIRTGEITHQTQYGITSLTSQEASAERLLNSDAGIGR